MVDQIEDKVSNAHFWDQKYRSGETSWDLNGPTPAISNWIDQFTSEKKICLLGAGNGYDAVEISKHGHQVYAVDFSETAISNMMDYARILNKPVHPILADLFDLPEEYNEYFDIVIEYTCFCAINPGRREEYRDVVYRILKPGGILMALFFPINKPLSDDGPPFGVDLAQTISLFEEKFLLKFKQYSPLTIQPRVGNEVLTELQKV